MGTPVSEPGPYGKQGSQVWVRMWFSWSTVENRGEWYGPNSNAPSAVIHTPHGSGNDPSWSVSSHYGSRTSGRGRRRAAIHSIHAPTGPGPPRSKRLTDIPQHSS